MSIIDRVIKAHKDARRPIRVPEWPDENGEPTVLYFPPLTTAAVEAADARMEDDGLDPRKRELDRKFYLLVHQAELEDGEKAFRIGDITHLKDKGQYTLFMRLVAFMYKSDIDATAVSAEELLEAAKKKSGQTETSDSVSE